VQFIQFIRDSVAMAVELYLCSSAYRQLGENAAEKSISKVEQANGMQHWLEEKKRSHDNWAPSSLFSVLG